MITLRGRTAVLLVAGGTVAGLLVAAIVLSVLGKSPARSAQEPSLYVMDEYRGGALRPGASGWWTKEGRTFIRINSEGLRDREHSKAKPSNSYRIAVLGDSYAEAFQVSMEQTFWAVLERRLKRCPLLGGRDVEVINFGVSGYGTAQELITLRRKVWEYSPDMVFLAFCDANDVVNNSPALEPEPYRPFFVYRNGTLVEDRSFLDLPAERRFATSHSFVDKLPRWMAQTWGMQLVRSLDIGWKRRRQDAVIREQTAQMYRVPTEAVWQDAWRVTEALITIMADEVQQRGAHFFLMTIDGGIAVHPDPRVRWAYMKMNGVADIFYPERRLKALGDREHIHVFNLAPPFQAYAQKNQVCLHGFDNGVHCGGHWNAEGHRLAGELAAEEICNRLGKQEWAGVKLSSDGRRVTDVETKPQARPR